MSNLAKEAIAEIREFLRLYGTENFSNRFNENDFIDNYCKRLDTIPVEECRAFVFELYRACGIDLELRLTLLNNILQKSPRKEDYINDSRLKKLEWHAKYGLREKDL